VEEKRLRKIQSFVLREGRLSNRQARALTEMWPTVGLEAKSCSAEQLQEIAEPFDKVVLEIGFGMGKSLVEMAVAEPQTLFIGIEVHKPGVGALLADVQDQAINNVRVFCEDALNVLNHSVSDNFLDRLQLFFPDPWHKKRHHKRRIVQPGFVELVASKLKAGGVFHAATDWENYAEHMLEILEASSLQNQAGTNQFAEKPGYRPLTKFEARGQRLGHGVWDLLFQK
jgi:tRNA (guanine-N7-)-methyltransferase